ncbi:MAG TPA: glycoside hydrolase domain-containing protein, partial [Planctomycetota bacterium]|nr:glycoside hydrolase domain-containing protein [Planctomycetota bacterium]
GTGTAWFDDVSLECLSAPAITATAGAPETISITEEGADAPWYTDNTVAVTWNCRAPVRMVNVRDEAVGPVLAAVELAPLLARLRGRAGISQARVVFAGAVVPHYVLGDLLLFECTIPPRTARTYYVYFSENAAVPDDDADASSAALVSSPLNLVRNPSFELGGTLPDGWYGGGPGEHPPGVTMGLEDGGLFGSRCAAIHYPTSVPRSWTGWRQNVPVSPYATYLYAAWLKSENVSDSVQIYAHYRNAAGELCQTKQYASAGPAISGTAGWTLLYGLFEMPPDISFFQLHLTMLATGNLWHDGALLAETLPATAGSLELRSVPGGTAAWLVNAIVKVFPDTLPPNTASAARISVAKNEKEPLQVAFRSTQANARVEVVVEPPVKANGAVLGDVETAVVGFVPIDHKTNYYNISVPAWRRKFPTAAGACDGWPGLWPDPLMPASSFSIAANTTQPVWVTVRVPRDAEMGDYAGHVRFVSADTILADLPFTVHVWDFALPVENHVSAIYDVRVQYDSRWALPGKTTQQAAEEFWQFMADRRLCPDRIWPDPVFHYANGVATADFTAYDAAAEFYFTTLKRPHTYTPQCFYLFGWGHPPEVKWGEAPYEGEYPYPDVNRAILRPQFKQAYQACLRVYWDHLKQKGWDRKCVLYISDEPHFSQPEIIDQMKALCTMIHEVDPAIRIYSSTWSHVPEWDGYLDVWGISHYGLVPTAKIRELLDSGDTVWWTTDGQMCTDTPYAAIERLLPHYCFKYGAAAYEFWGIDWLTYDPWKFGWHSYINQSPSPGEYVWVRYPNGDGFLAYPGAPAGLDRPVSSVRMEQAREGCEDYEYLDLLRRLIVKCENLAVDAGDAPQAAQSAAGLVTIPNAGGRYSTKILPDPDALLRTKDALGAAIERLSQRFRPPAWPIAGDANNDCRVNVLDLIYIRNRLNADPAEIDNACADVNGDGKINVLDLIAARNVLGTRCP